MGMVRSYTKKIKTKKGIKIVRVKSHFARPKKKR